MYVSEKIGDEYKNWGAGDIILLTAPTGTGKTTFILETLLPYIMQKNGRLLYLVNRRVLREQLLEELNKRKNKYLLQRTGSCSINRYISIETYQQYEKRIASQSSASRVVEEISKYTCVVYDECHYFYADSSFNTYAELSYDLLRMVFASKIQIFMSATMDNMESFIRGRYYYLPNIFPFESHYTIKKYDTLSDYSYINLSYFNTQDEMKKIVADSTVDDKWLIFTDSIDAGKNLCAELKVLLENKEEVGYIDAKYAYNEESQEIIDEITKDNITQKRILIATAVIDNGISIKDRDLRNLVIMADTKESFIQMLGRRRPDGNRVNLYICKRDEEYFKRRLRYVNEILTFFDKQAVKLNEIFQDFGNNGFVFPLIKNYFAGQQPVFFSWYIQQPIMMNILSDTRTYMYAKKILYSINGIYAVNSFSLRRFQQLQVFYQDILKEMSEDEDAFIKEQAKWIGKNENEIMKAIQESKEELDEIHRKEIEEYLEDFIKKDISKEDNQKKLKPNLKKQFLHFLQNAEITDEEEKKEIKNAEDALRKNDRTISDKDFNLIMKLANLPYKMSKKGGSTFWIEKVQN